VSNNARIKARTAGFYGLRVGNCAGMSVYSTDAGSIFPLTAQL
jgi:hypothetical protein